MNTDLYALINLASLAIYALLGLVILCAGNAMAIAVLLLKKHRNEMKLRNAFAQEMGFTSYRAYIKDALDCDAGIDEKDGYNQWLGERLAA